MKPKKTKPISSICTKFLTAMLLFVAAAAVTLGVSARPVYAGFIAGELSVGQTMTIDASDYSKVKSSNPKVVKVIKKNGKYILKAMKSGGYQEDEKSCWFADAEAVVSLYKKGKCVDKLDICVLSKAKLITVGKSISYKASGYSSITSDDPKILKMTKKDGKYVVTAKKEGNTRIRLYKKGKLSKVVSVMALKKSSLKIKTSTITVKKGKKLSYDKLFQKLNVTDGKYGCVITPKNISVLYPTDSRLDLYIHARKKGTTTLMLNLITEDGCIFKTYRIKVKVK